MQTYLSCDGGPRDRVVKSADISLLHLTRCFDHLTALSGVGSSPIRGICETSQVLLADVPGGFSWGSSVFVPPTNRPVSCELK